MARLSITQLSARLGFLVLGNLRSVVVKAFSVRQATITVEVKHLGLSEIELQRLSVMVGPRLNKDQTELKIVVDRFDIFWRNRVRLSLLCLDLFQGQPWSHL